MRPLHRDQVRENRAGKRRSDQAEEHSSPPDIFRLEREHPLILQLIVPFGDTFLRKAEVNASPIKDELSGKQNGAFAGA
jgi:hypothetical protein